MTQTTTESRRSALRPEARAVEWGKLDQQQQTAFNHIMDLLDEAATAVAGLEPPEAKPPRPYLEAERSSRTALIYGRRGTGKTTLLLSLLKALAKPTDARPVGRKVVLLDTLDMEPLAESTNLIGAVLARLEEAAGSSAEAAEQAGTWSRAGRVSGEEAVMMKIAKLQTRAASAFGSNLRDRAGGLDPDNFAVEVRRAERHRMDFGQQFAHVVAEVAEHLKKTRANLGQAPLFVLPVDDLDLNPTACVPLLEGLRAVHSPHLFVLLLADLRLIETVLRLQYQARFIHTGRSKALDPETRGHVGDLATNAVRKHLPPSQRLHLARVAPMQAVNFRLFGDDRVTDVYEIFGDTRLAADRVWLPERVDLTVVAPSRTIGEAKTFWLPDPTTDQTEGTAPRVPIWRYSWVEVFRMSFRELVDAVLDAEVATVQDGVGETVPDERRTDPKVEARRRRMTQLAQDRLETVAPGAGLAVEARPDGSIRHVLEADVVWTTEELQQPDGYRLQTASLAGWSAEWGGISLDRTEQRELAGILDIEDADADLPFRAYIARSCPPLRRTLPPGVDEPAEDWPMPRHSTCWGYEDAARLLALADSAWAELSDRWFGAWIDAMTRTIEQALDIAAPSPVETAPSPDETGWPSVHQRLRRLSLRPLGRRWRVEVLALCTPEMGMLDWGVLQPIQPSVEEHKAAQQLRVSRAQKHTGLFQELARRQLWS